MPIEQKKINYKFPRYQSNTINEFIQRRRFLVLLISLLFFLLLMPFLSETSIYSYSFDLSFSLVMIFCLYIIGHNRPLLLIAIILAASSIILNWIKAFSSLDYLLLAIDYFITMSFLALITIMALSYVIKDKVITNSTLCGAICCYLLLGLTWSFLYLLIDYFDPSAFTTLGTIQVLDDTSLQKYIYYSYITLTTLGYGDIVPNANLAKTFSWLEAVIGQIYLTVLIARLVGLHIAQKDN